MSPSYASNAAYDLSLFEEQEKRPKLEEVKLPKKQTVLNLSPIRLIMLGLVLVAMAGTLLYTQVALSEVTAQINAANRELEELNNEQTRLEMELNRKMSIGAIEEYATQNLNMNKIEQYQVELISIEQQDEVAVNVKKEESFVKSLWNRIFG